MAASRYIFASILALAVASSIPFSVYAQDDGNSMTKPLSGGSLDIKLEPITSTTGDVTFKVSFLNPGTTTGHQHQDYDFIIKQGDNEIFSAAKQTNQVVIHTAETTIMIPFKFQENGDYSVEVKVLGLGFPPTPITPESAVFQFTVTPEFPAGIAAVMATVVGSTVLLGRRFVLP
jgi:hypothetical protein